MSRRRVAVSIVTLVLLAGGLVALLLRHDNSNSAPGLNATTNAAAPGCVAAEPKTANAEPSGNGGIEEKIHETKDAATEAARPATDPDGAEDQWTLKGKLKLKLDIEFDLAARLGGDSLITLVFAPEDRRSAKPLRTWITLGPDLQFEETAYDSTFGIQPGDSIPAGTWYLYEKVDGSDSSDEGNRVLPDSAKVSPTISGRVIDFGTIEWTLEQVLPEQVVFTGRVIGGAGTPLRYGGEYFLTSGGDLNWGFALHLDRRGYFLVSRNAKDWEAKSATDKLKWTLRLNEREWDMEDYGSRSVESSFSLKAPRKRSNVLDFGTIKVGGGLVEIEVTGIDERPETSPSGGLILSRLGGSGRSTIKVDFDGGHFWAEAQARVSPHNAILWLPEGRFRYRVSVSYRAPIGDDEVWYEIPGGSIVVRSGRVTQLKLRAVKLATVEVEVRAEGKLLHPVKSIMWEFEGESRASYEYLGRPWSLSVPVRGDSGTRITVKHPGYLTASAVAKVDDKKIVIELVPDPTAGTGLNVHFPSVPDRWSSQIRRFTISISGESYREDFEVYQDRPPLPVKLEESGRYRVWLVHRDAPRMGYRSNIVSGPVEVDLSRGEYSTVKLPNIEPPPWEMIAKSIVSVARCDGHPIALVTLGEFEGGRHGPVDFSDDSEFNGPVPSAIVDGSNRPRVKLEAPLEPGGEAHVRIDLPARIEVRATRKGLPLGRFQVKIEGRAPGTPDSLQTTCEAAGLDGIAKLWWPEGTATITTTAGGREIDSRTIEVRAGALLVIEVSSQLVKVEFVFPSDGDDEGPEEPDVITEYYPCWILQRVVDGRLDPEVLGEFIWDETVMLAAGVYRLAPSPGDRKLAFDLDLISGADRIVRLSRLPALRGGGIVRISVPEALLTRADGSFSFYARPLNVAESVLATPAFDNPMIYLSYRLLDKGLLLTGLPVGIDVVLTGGTPSEWSWGNDEVWLLRPVKIKAVRGKTIDIAASWRKGMDLHDEWEELNAWSLDLLPGACLSFRTSGYALPGRYEITVFDDKGHALSRHTVTFKDTEGGFPIPPDLRADLIRLGLLDDDE